MRDPLDTKTADLVPSKRGRPCVDPERGPLTQAERAAAYRARRKKAARSAPVAAVNFDIDPNAPKTVRSIERVSTVALIDALRSAVSDGRLSDTQRLMRLLNHRLVESAD